MDYTARAMRGLKKVSAGSRTRLVFINRPAGWGVLLLWLCGVSQARASFAFQLRAPPPPTVYFSDVSVVKTNVTASPVLYVEALNTESNQFVQVYPKLIGQPVNATVGTAPLSNGVYTLSFYFRFIDLVPDEFYLRWNGGVSAIVRFVGTGVPSGVPVIYPDVWYKGSLTVTVSDGSDTGAFHFRMLRNDFGYSPDFAVQFRDISMLDGAGQERMQSSIDYANTGIDQEPLNVRKGGTATVRRFCVMNNLEHQSVPDWFDAQRVHLHTALRINAASSNSTHIFQTAENHLGSYGYTGTFTRWVKKPLQQHLGPSIDGPYWPTAVPDEDPPFGEPWFNSLIVWGGVTNSIPAMSAARAHSNGFHEIGSYYMMAEDHIATNHPEWISKNENGANVLYKSSDLYLGDWLCQNSPYRDVVSGRLKELVYQGVDGVYFDEIHQSLCWCIHCYAAFEKRYGAHPTTNDTYGISFKNPQYIKLFYQRGDTITKAFRDYQTVIHGVNPKACSPISASQFKFWDFSSLPASFVETLQSPKWEFQTQFSRRAYLYNVWFPGGTIYPEEDQLPVDSWCLMAFTFLRDAAGGRPPHIWCEPWAGHTDFDETVSGTEWQTIAAFLFTAGCIPNLHIREATIEQAEAWNSSYQPAVELGLKMSPLLAGAKPYKWAGIHFNEHARDQIYLRGGHSTKQDAYTEIVAPVLFAYETLAKQSPQVPVMFITDGQLARGEIGDYDCIFLPSDDMTPPMAETVSNFTGTVIRQSEQTNWIWHVASTRPTYEFRAAVFPNGSVTNAPIRVTQTSTNKFTTGFYTKIENGVTNYLVTICNDMEWLFSDNLSNEEKAAYAPSTLTEVKVCFTVPVKTGGEWIKDTSGSTNLTSIAGIVSGNEINFEVGTVAAMAILKVEAQ